MRKLYLNEINRRCRTDPAAFIAESEQQYQKTILAAAQTVCQQHREKPIVLLNGPSSSGKTTTARCLRDALERMGIHSHAISMDDYFMTRGTYTMPLDEEGNMDLESPACMELDLLAKHLCMLANGEEIEVPQYDFHLRRRKDEREVLRLGKDEIVVIEGIHALNDMIVEPIKRYATGIYMAVGTEVIIKDSFHLAPHKLRFVRRAIRDKYFRNEPINGTIAMWRSVRRGEKQYIHPYVLNASRFLDTYLPYEDCILMNLLREEAMPFLREMKEAKLDDVVRAFDLFEPIADRSLLPEITLMHEFIG